jgi:hypothetical protein
MYFKQPEFSPAYGFEKERLEIYSAERKCFLNVIQHLGFGNALAKV